MAIIGVTAIKLLSSFFQVVFIDCPFRLCWQSTHRPPYVFVESLAPSGGSLAHWIRRKGSHQRSYRPAVRD